METLFNTLYALLIIITLALAVITIVKFSIKAYQAQDMIRKSYYYNYIYFICLITGFIMAAFGSKLVDFSILGYPITLLTSVPFMIVGIIYLILYCRTIYKIN